MTTYLRALAAGFVIWATLASLPGRAEAQARLTLSGRVTLQMRGALPRFTARLYPSRETKRPTLVTYTDASGNFKFTDLDAGRYLLELYQGNTLVYQKVLTLNSSQSLTIPLKVRS